MSTVRDVLNSLQLVVRVVVRRRENGLLIPLGGGFSDTVIRRFGDCEVLFSDVQDSVLILYVK